MNIKRIFYTRRHPDSNWGIEDLQSTALPLGHIARIFFGFYTFLLSSLNPVNLYDNLILKQSQIEATRFFKKFDLFYNFYLLVISFFESSLLVRK